MVQPQPKGSKASRTLLYFLKALHVQSSPLRCLILSITQFLWSGFNALSCKVPLWKYYILICNVQKSLWFTNPSHTFPTLIASFQLGWVHSSPSGHCLLLPHLPFHLALHWALQSEELGKLWEGWGQVRAVATNNQRDKETELGCESFSHAALLAPSTP